jgi:hypothetical protein
MMDEIRVRLKKSERRASQRESPEVTRKLGVHILANAKDALPFEVRVSGFENRRGLRSL